MQTAAHLDFQLYVALLASELPRFTVPGLGSFVWHVEKAHVDPRTGVVSPPKPTLKHEPGHRYQAETVAFLRDHFGLPEAEAEALLREIGRLAAAYLRTASEMDLWRLGKIKRVGGVYKVELQEEAIPPIAVGLEEVNLRAGASSVVSLPKAAPPSSSSKGPETSRARVREAVSSASPSEEPSKVPPQPRSSRRWVPLGVSVVVVAAILAGVTFWMVRKRTPPQPVEIRLEGKGTASTAPQQRPSSALPGESSSPTKAEKTASTPPSASPPSAVSPKRTSPPAGEPKQVSPPSAKAPEPAPPQKAAPPGPTYYIIVGSYPSRAEAEQKAAAFPGYKIEYLPGKDPGWVRLSVYSSKDKAAVQQRYREVKAKVPDAWIFTAP